MWLQSLKFYWTESRTNWIAQFRTYYQVMDESDLWDAKANLLTNQFVRFAWLRTWHKPVVVRIDASGENSFVIVTKLFSGMANHVENYGPLEAINITTSASAYVRLLFEDTTRGIRYIPEYDGRIGPDGALWIIDCVVSGKYSFVWQQSPSSGWIYERGLKFMEVGGVKENERY